MGRRSNFHLSLHLGFKIALKGLKHTMLHHERRRLSRRRISLNLVELPGSSTIIILHTRIACSVGRLAVRHVLPQIVETAGVVGRFGQVPALQLRWAVLTGAVTTTRAASLVKTAALVRLAFLLVTLCYLANFVTF